MRQFLATVIIVLSCAGCSSSPDPRASVRGFYTAYAASGARGLPSPAQTATLAPFLSARLLAQLDSARQIQSAYSAKYPEEKPPFIEGDLFSSNFEGFSGFAADTITALGNDRYSVTVNFWYVDPTDSGTIVRWYDRVEVTRQAEGDRIDDIEFCAPWPFSPKGRMSELLREDP